MIHSNGHYGYNIEGDSVMTFQVGGSSLEDLLYDKFEVRLQKPDMSRGYITQVEGLYVLSRGTDDRQIESISRDIKDNRLWPQLVEKQVKIMFGEGLHIYKHIFTDEGKLERKWEGQPDIYAWLNSWNDQGLTDDYQDMALSSCRRVYSFEDQFVKWRFMVNDLRMKRRCAGLELIENSKARLASDRDLGFTQSNYEYDDFNHVVVGDWRHSGRFKIYPRFDFRKVNEYNVAISHHVIDDIDSIYGRNKSYQGSREWIEAANENPRFIRSFLHNSLAAKIHIIIPIEWVESVREKIKKLCQENRDLQAQGKPIYDFHGIKIGTKYSEAFVDQYTKKELNRVTEFLSGADNQGKAFSSYSFRTTDGKSVEWKFENIDLKYKEYIEALITLDRRIDEVMVESVGLDPSISNISKEGVISKSGSDALYNYLIYLSQLPSTEKVICDPFNMAIRVNFPELFRDGYRVGFYRNVPLRQQDTPVQDRLTNTQ